MNCPLCKSSDTKKLETVNVQDLMRLYRQMTKCDFSYLLSKKMEYLECSNCKLRFFSPFLAGDEAFYNALQCFEWYYMDEKNEFLEASKYINNGNRVLEVGSGKGAFVKYLPTKNYVGLDFSEKAKEIASKSGVKIKNETIESYATLNPSSADIVVSFQVLEHVADPNAFIKAKLESLVVGGKMIIAVPSEDSFLRHVKDGILNMPPHHVTRWSDDTLRFIAQQFNLELVTIYHERLQDVHKKWFLQTLINSHFLAPSLLSSTLVQKMTMIISSVISKRLVCFLKRRMLPNGHTVMAVYRKK